MSRPARTDTPTLKQLARQCGVSTMTVSRALRSDMSVAEETRRRILATAEESGYQPRVKMGRPRRTQTAPRSAVEVIMGFRRHSLYDAILLRTVERQLVRRRYDCVVRSTGVGFEEFVQLCETLRDSPTVPTLVVGYLPHPQLHTLLEVRPETVLVDNTGDPNLETPYSSIGFDIVEVARFMVRHLLSAQRRRILLLKGFAEHYFSRDIERGYREALTLAGVPIDEALIGETDFTPGSAVERIREAFASGLAFDAVLTNDEMAAGVLHALHEEGVRVPEDVAVAGSDGLPSSRYTLPPLTTVVLDYEQLAVAAVEYALDPERASAPPCRIRLLPRLEARESTGSARG